MSRRYLFDSKECRNNWLDSAIKKYPEIKYIKTIYEGRPCIIVKSANNYILPTTPFF